jgi:hypothetical protein
MAMKELREKPDCFNPGSPGGILEAHPGSRGVVAYNDTFHNTLDPYADPLTRSPLAQNASSR